MDHLYGLMEPSYAFTTNSTSPANAIMHPVSSLLLLGTYAFQRVAGLVSSGQSSGRSSSPRSLDSFVQQQTSISLSRILCNVGSDGCSAHAAAQGALLASPSQNNPNYFYMWTRDSALTFKTIIDTFTTTTYNETLQIQIEKYIIAQAHLQGTSNPSGVLADGSGLGEPKFNVDLSAFTGNWGRPQRDGPALRAIALSAYAKWLIHNGYTSTVTSVLWPIIRNDLSYVAQYWDQSGFDLWEEVNGMSFFTTANQHRALVEGSALAKMLGVSCASCDAIAPQLLCSLQGYWDQNDSYIISNTNGGRSGKDVNSILSIISTFDPLAGCDSTTFQPCSDRALANHKVVTDSFRSVYDINKNISQGKAVNVGRYPEDVYYNGNPWYLATLAAAEQLYDALYVWKAQSFIEVTATSSKFFNDFSPGVAVGKYNASTSQYSTLYSSISAYAEGYMNLVAQYAAPNGSLSEQYGKTDGKPLSAYDLTWSYAAFLTAAARRASIMPESWSEAQGRDLPSTCAASSIVGYYSSATATSFPASQTPVTTTTNKPPTATPTACATVDVVNVKFDEKKATAYGQNVKLTGNLDALGNWNPDKAVSLSAAGYTSSNPTWSITVSLKAGQVLQYKFVTVNSDGSYVWEADPNHTYTVPVSCATAVAVSNTWQ